MIYFGDPEIVEKNLHEDLNIIIKNVKVRQEQHLQLLEYNKSIATKKRSIQSTIFINDQIMTHNKFLSKNLLLNTQVLKDEKLIIEKYDGASVKFQSVMKLLARVVARILQTNQIFIDKIKLYDETFFQKFIKMKNTLTKLVNNKQQIDLSQSTKTIIEYTQHKTVHQIEKLKNLIKKLQDGQMQKQVYMPKSPKPKIQQVKIVKHIVADKSPIKKQQKHEKISKIKQQLKQQQKHKKQRKTLANRMITMYGTMDISRRQFMQDFNYNNSNQQYNKLYHEIFARNKFNHQQILQFQGKKQQFAEKVRIFKQAMLIQSHNIQQMLIIRKPIKLQKRDDIHSQSVSKLQILQQNKNPQVQIFDEPIKDQKKSFILRQKGISPRFHKEADYQMMNSTQQGFSHIKFDASGNQTFLRSNRNRLPSIQTKPYGYSVDSQNLHQQMNLSKAKEDKTQQVQPLRKNMLMKNIQVGVQNVIKNNQHKNKSESKQISEKMKEIHPSNGPLMQMTFYGGKKKLYVLGDTKINFPL